MTALPEKEHKVLLARLRKLERMADPLRNASEHERAVAASKLAELRKQLPVVAPSPKPRYFPRPDLDSMPFKGHRPSPKDRNTWHRVKDIDLLAHSTLRMDTGDAMTAGAVIQKWNASGGELTAEEWAWVGHAIEDMWPKHNAS